MTNFAEKDIEALDFILSQSIINHNVTTDDLIKVGLIPKNNDNGFELDLGYNPVSEFVRYMDILDELGVCECNFKEDCESVRKNRKTENFQRNGGIKTEFFDRLEKANFARKKSNLEIENLELQKEASEHQISLRNKEEQIRNLTTDNLRLGNWDIRFRWYIAVGGFLIGFITKYFIDN